MFLLHKGEDWQYILLEALDSPNIIVLSHEVQFVNFHNHATF